MVTPEQPTDQTTPTRPTPEQIALARIEVEDLLQSGGMIDNINKIAVYVLLAATAPPTDDEICAFVAARQAIVLPGNHYASKQEHQMRNLATGDRSYPIAIVVDAIRHFLGPVKP